MIDILIRAKGDLKHHTVEDTALALGAVLSEALGDRNGIRRFFSDYAPIYESLALVSVDLVKRPYFVPTDLEFRLNYIEDLAREDLQHFFRSFCTTISCTTHIHLIYGSNKAEACFKALALALREAVALDERRSTTPSSKGSM